MNGQSNIRDFFRNRTNIFLYRANALITISIFTILLYFYNKLPPQIPFFYSRPRGIEQLAPKHYIIFFCMLSLIISLLNIFIALGFYKNEKQLSFLISFASPAVSLLVFLAVLRIIILVL